MITARISNGTFILGIDAENVRQLKGGQPIHVSLSEFGGTDNVAIMYGETLASIRNELEAVFGPLPPEKKLDKVREPQEW
jgi:hypothetical protein